MLTIFLFQLCKLSIDKDNSDDDGNNYCYLKFKIGNNLFSWISLPRIILVFHVFLCYKTELFI